jgi:phenylpyruvate tautomerase PptA (4-oxalocrotonate tautomerase family)
MPFLQVKLIEGVFDDTQKSEMLTKLTDAIVEVEGENMRACIVNFRTEAADVDALLDVAAELGARLDDELRVREAEVRLVP